MSRSSTRSSAPEPGPGPGPGSGPGADGPGPEPGAAGAAAARALRDARPVSFWLDQPDAPAPAAPLRGNATAGLAVVGGGFTGLWTALLAKERDPARDVVLLEGRTVGWAASGRNGGFCSASLTHGPANGFDRFGPEMPPCTGSASRIWTRSRPRWRVTPSTADSSGPVS